MRIFSNDSEYIGTPQELKEFFNNNTNLVKDEPTTPFIDEDFMPLESVVNESEQLRRSLAQNPNYNPFGGVVAGNEPDQRDNSAIVSSDLDTGVAFK